jgi:hypothetical protein
MALKRAAAKFGVGLWLYDKDQTSGALALHFKAEKEALLQEWGKVLDALQLDHQQVIDRLKRQAGVERNVELPLATIKACLWQLSTSPNTLIPPGGRDT